MSDDFDPYRCRGVTPPGGPTMEELTLAVWKERALRAEQRAEAAEAERDRMRLTDHESELLAQLRRDIDLRIARTEAHEGYGRVDDLMIEENRATSAVLSRLIDAYRAGQPATSEAERIAATLVCSTCNDTHRMTLGDREVPCTRCPVPCETCRSRPVGAGPGAYCAGTPCGCPCHRAGAWRKP